MRASILTSMLGHFFSVLFSSHVLEIVCIRRIQSVTRASQRKSRDETRLLARSARPRETRRDDWLDDEHQTSLQKRTFFILSLFLRVQTRPSTASLECHRSSEARRRDTHCGVVTHILITRATRPNESMRERTMRSVCLCFTRARA